MPKEDLSQSKPVESVLWGREIEVPDIIRETLLDGEKVLHAIQQSRFTQLITPDSIFVTNKRVILHKPHTLGLRRTIQDYKFVDMANTEIVQGFISSDIKIKMRFLSEPVLLKRIPTKVARGMFKTIQLGIENRLAEPVQETVFKPPVTQSFVEDDDIIEDTDLIEEPEIEPEFEKEDLMTILKRRYVTGEITRKEYLEMKKELGPVTPKKPRKKKKTKKKKRVKKKTSKRKKRV